MSKHLERDLENLQRDLSASVVAAHPGPGEPRLPRTGPPGPRDCRWVLPDSGSGVA